MSVQAVQEALQAAETVAGGPDLIAQLQSRLSELKNELAALRNVPAPTSGTTLQKQYSELMGQIMSTLMGGGIEGQGLIGIMNQMWSDYQEGTGPMDVQIFVGNNKGLFTAMLGDLENGNIGGQTLQSAAETGEGSLANFLAGVIDQNGQNFLDKMIKDAANLDPQ